jgi:NAD dependent epimerase/dehydratase
MIEGNWSHTHVLVTGAGGFIGSHLAERLVGLGARTRALVHYNSMGLKGWLESSPLACEMEILASDVRDAALMRKATTGVDVVFHLAALIGIPYSYEAPSSYVHTNIEGTLNILQASLNNGVQRVVCTSTSEVYGSARHVPINEDHPLQAQSPYAASKIGADKMAESFHCSFGLPVTIARPFNTYGPRQSARAVIPTIVTQALSRETVELGSLEPTRDFNYVGDTVDGFIRIASADAAVGKVINFGSGKEISVGNLARLIGELMGRELHVVACNERVRPTDSEVDRLCADNRRARELLRWSPRYSLRDGLAETIEWLGKNPGQYRVGVYAL